MAYTTEDDPLEDHPLFTPDLEYYTAPTHQPLDNSHAYSPRTLTPYTREPTDASLLCDREGQEEEKVDFLLCNVPKEELSQLQLARRVPNAYVACFDLIEHNFEMIDPIQDSFMLSIYRQLLYDLSMKWKMSMPILDYNLARLRQCAKKCLEQLQQQERQEKLQLFPSLPSSATFSIEELPIALEFYLQLDVDLFYMKTCSFRGAQPIETSIFCMKSPAIPYSLTACNKSSCLCCHPRHPRIYPGQIEVVQFNLKEKYQFLNGYQSILNCPATCDTKNMIYTLRCPCEQFEYIGITTISLQDCLTMHRNESNRILREFILGPKTTSHILQGIKSEEARRNDRLWLYQHTARCPIAMQLFLDVNPDYWCLVPMSEEEVQLRTNTNIPPSSSRTMRRSISRSSSSQRLENDAKYLIDNLPEPPERYHFTERQRFAQVCFFHDEKEGLLNPPIDNNVDLYNAAIIAVLPENCSELLRQLILSLFLTHTDCNLNKTGRLIVDTSYQQYPFRGYWCSHLIYSAKVIWKAIHDEQALGYEIALFKNWLSSSKSSSSFSLCTFRDLALTYTNDILTHLIFDQQLSSITNHSTNNDTNSIDQFIENIIKQTISVVETIAEHYVQTVNDEKEKILNKQEKFKKPPTVDTIITIIENRQLNMVQRAQYHIEQTLKTLFRTTINEIN